MQTFAKIGTQLINKYKVIIKKHLTSQEWAQKMSVFELRRKYMRNDDEVALYHKAKRVLEDLCQHLQDNNNGSIWYSGLDEFCQHMKNTLDEFHVENNQIIHCSQLASRTLVRALQLANLPEHKRNSVAGHQLDHCGQIIAKYGTREQQEMFAKAIKQFQHHDVNFFMPLQKNFDKYMHEFAQLFVPNNPTIPNTDAF